MSDRGFFAHGIYNLTPGECLEYCREGAVIVDVRESYMNNFKVFGISEVLYMPFSELEEKYESLPLDKPLVFADAVGLKSREAVLFMTSRGYSNVFNMAGGIVDWERDGLPIATDINNRLSGSCMCQLKTREGASGRVGDGEK